MKTHRSALPIVFVERPRARTWLLLVAAMCVAPVASGQMQFAPSVVTGIKVQAGQPNPAVLFEDRDILSSTRLCNALASEQGRVRAAVDDGIGKVNQKLRGSVPGVLIVRHQLSLSASCSAVADAATVGVPNGGGVRLAVKLPANRLEFNVTTPDVVGLGLPQGADPRLFITFDLELTGSLTVPKARGEQFRSDSAVISVRNISVPKGLNFTGAIVGELADVATSVYDYFNGGELGRRLAQGGSQQKAVPDAVVARLNTALQLIPPHLNHWNPRFDPQRLVVLHATDGTRVADPSCISGFVWRQVRADDLVCVEPEVRAQVRADNQRAAERRTAAPDPGRLQLCSGGVSVLGAPSATPTATHNSCLAAAYRIPCKQGFVWREAVADDYVCVTPDVRSQARKDNAEARRRRNDYESVIR